MARGRARLASASLPESGMHCMGRDEQDLYREAGLSSQAKLLLEVHKPGGGVVHHVLMPHADALLPRLQAYSVR